MNDRRTKTDSTVIPFLITNILAILTVVCWFATTALKAGKGKELAITSPILIGTYYLMGSNYQSIHDLWLWLVPITIFSIYWVYLLSQEPPITNPNPNPCWANRNWWWTLDGWSFEEEVAEVFRLNGYDVEVTKKTGDGGVDLILWKDDMKTIVQCKHYKAPIPVAYVRELNGVREDYRAQKVIMVASSGCTSQGYQFIENKPYYTILELDDIIEMGLRPNFHTP